MSSGSSSFTKLGQKRKVATPNFFTELGISILFKFIQSINAESPIDSIVGGRTIAPKLSQSRKAFAPILFTV